MESKLHPLLRKKLTYISFNGLTLCISSFDNSMLGVAMVCGLLEVFISLLSPRVIRKLFPNLVASVTVILLGVALIGTGMKYWGGGVVCAEMIWKEHAQVVDSVGFPPDFPVFPFSSATCSNGDVALVAGSPEYIGLGFSVFAMLVLIELFGSVFMKNCNVILALLFGYLIAALSSHEGNDYVLGDKIRDAEPITFLWVETFPLGKLKRITTITSATRSLLI